MHGTVSRASPGMAAAFGGLSTHAQSSLAEWASSHVFERGEFVFRAGDPADLLHVIDSGAVKLGLLGADGREGVVAIFGPGECFGELRAHEQRHNARAVELSRVTVVPLDAVRECLGPETDGALLELVSEQLCRMTAALHGVMRGDIRIRIATRLCDLAERHGRKAPEGGTQVGIHLTQEDLARMTGASRETVNKVLSQFARKGWVQGSHGRYVIKDRDALLELAGG